MAGIFGNLFDFDGDGELNSFEQAAEFATFASMMDEDLNEDGEFDDEDDEFDDEEDGGLDPDDYDF